MKEAYGGIFNLMFIIIFLVIVIGVLGMTFSYTKAFRMKNAILAAIEENEGNMKTSSFKKQVLNAAQIYGYNKIHTNCSTYGAGFEKADSGLFCFKKVAYGAGCPRKTTYIVITEVDIDFPIMEDITGLRMFKVSGETKEINVKC